MSIRMQIQNVFDPIVPWLPWGIFEASNIARKMALLAYTHDITHRSS